MKILTNIQEAASFIQRQCSIKPKIGIVLGSGLGAFADSLNDGFILPYKEIPNFPLSSVEGHKGELKLGFYHDIPCVMMCGRVHYYEGYSMSDVVFPIRVLKQLGVETLIVTNAAGAINLKYKPGDMMVIQDHINLTGHNPLRGENISLGPRFPDMTQAYSHKGREALHAAAKEKNIPLHEGIYAGVVGPSYETPAEIRMLRTLGADAVGMSTVSEVIAARHAGLEVVGLSVLTNYAAGVIDTPLLHEDVTREGEKARAQVIHVVGGAIKRLV